MSAQAHSTRPAASTDSAHLYFLHAVQVVAHARGLCLTRSTPDALAVDVVGRTTTGDEDRRLGRQRACLAPASPGLRGVAPLRHRSFSNADPTAWGVPVREGREGQRLLAGPAHASRPAVVCRWSLHRGGLGAGTAGCRVAGCCPWGRRRAGNHVPPDRRGVGRDHRPDAGSVLREGGRPRLEYLRCGSGTRREATYVQPLRQGVDGHGTGT